MGRIKTAFVKRVTNKLVSDNQGIFKKDFNENKKIVGKFATIKSKKIRNIIAGYTTRIVKRQNDLTSK